LLANFLVNYFGSSAVHVLLVRTECNQPSFRNIPLRPAQGGDPIGQCEIDDLPTPRVEEDIGNYVKSGRS
jgi:hypothetical protein